MLQKFWKNKQAEEEQQELDVEAIELSDQMVEEIKIEAEHLKEETIQKHEKHYSNQGFWEKIQKFSKKAGSTVVYAVLLLYFTLQKPEIPLKVKATIAGALGYFILPFDLLPDVALGVGFVDDLGVITAALIQVAMYVDEDVKKQAKDKLAEWFGNQVDTSEIDNKL